MNKYRTIAFAALVTILFFAVSLELKRQTPFEARWKPEFSLAPFRFASQRELHAESLAWFPVRQSVSWARNNSTAVDGILNSLITTGALSRPGSNTYSNIVIQSKLYTLRVDVGGSYSATGTSFSMPKTFRNRFEVWESDNTKALELYFDNVGNVSDNGVLFIYRPKAFDPLQFTGNDTIVESYIYGDTSRRKQVYSWSNGPMVSGGVVDKGRVTLDEMNGEICGKVVIRFDTAASNPPCLAGNNDFYSLAYVIQLPEPHRTTARFGLLHNAIDNVTDSFTPLCNAAANTNKFGIFDMNGFVQDGFEPADIPADYPAADDVNHLYAESGTLVEGADDTRMDIMNALDVQFNSTAAP